MTNQEYKSKYDNKVRDFIKTLDTSETLQEVSKRLGVTYQSLHYAFKKEKISQALFLKIIKTYSLTEERKDNLRRLMAGF